MSRLNLVVEGQTEEGFVNSLLSPHLADRGVYARARCVATSRSRRKRIVYRGGVIDYGRLRKDIVIWMRQDRGADAWFSTMVDLFRFPDDFPGYADAMRRTDPYEMVEHLEQQFAEDLDHPRFIPYVQLHEFEALLLSDPQAFEVVFPDQQRSIALLAQMVGRFESPERIDLGDQTAPSKRIAAGIPEYADQKASAGPIIARQIGLEAMCRACPHFRQWAERLEALGSG